MWRQRHLLPHQWWQRDRGNPPTQTELIVSGLRGKAIAVGLTAAVVVTPTAGPAWAAEGSTGVALPDLPWSVMSASLEAIDVIATPMMGVGDALIDSARWIPFAEPVGHVVGVAGAALPVAADALRVVHRVADVPLGIEQIDEPTAPAAWQVPSLPDIDDDLTDLSFGTTRLIERLTAADACACLPFGLGDQLSRYLPDAVEAANALDTYQPAVGVFNKLAGYSEPGTYLLVIGNQAEMRPSGGAPLYAAVITAEEGRVTLADKGLTSTHFFPPMNREVTWLGVEANPYFAENPRATAFVNAGRHPDFAVSGAELAAAFEAGGHPAIDGVVYLDMTFLQGILELTGPLDVEGIGTVDAANLATELLENAYERTDSKATNAQRQAANDRLVEAFIDRVQNGLPVGAAIQEFTDAAAGRHLQVWFRDAETQSVFDELSWTGRLKAPADADWIAWYTQSGNPSKTDIKQDRSVVRNVLVEGTRAQVTTDFVITNANEPNNDPTIDERRGYQATWMRTATVIYLPTGATDVQVLGLENAEVAPLPGVRRSADLMIDASGRRFLRFAGWIPPLERALIRVAYSLELDDAAGYSVVMEPQAAFTAYEVTVDVRGSLGDSRVGPLPVEGQTVLTFP